MWAGRTLWGKAKLAFIVAWLAMALTMMVVTWGDSDATPRPVTTTSERDRLTPADCQAMEPRYEGDDPESACLDAIVGRSG